MAGLSGVHVSLAHTRGAVAAGAGWRPVGVDVEMIPACDIEVASSSIVLSAAELGRVRSAGDPSTAFLRQWVRKECLVKMGLATLDTLRGVEIPPGVEEAETRRTASRYGPVHLVDWVDQGMNAVVAAAGFEPPMLASCGGHTRSA